MNRPILAYLLLAAAIAGTTLLSPAARAEPAGELPPPTAGRQLIAAYFEDEPSPDHAFILKHIEAELSERGLGQRLVFPDNLRISLGRQAPKDEYRRAARELMGDSRPDLIISMGLTAAKALVAENNGQTPVIAVNIDDPVGSGLADKATGQIPANFIVRADEKKWATIFALFYGGFPFQRLGAMYSSPLEGVAYSRMKEARKVARELGIELIEYPHLDQTESLEACRVGLDWLLQQKIDAFYISDLGCFDSRRGDPQPLLDTLNDQSVKTFAREGSALVRLGALMGLSILDYVPSSKTYADLMAGQLGLPPLEAWSEPKTYAPKIALNLNTAKKLGLDVHAILLFYADELYDSTLEDIQDTTAVH